MKIPENFTLFNNIEEQVKKYREWNFGKCKKNVLPVLKYKGGFGSQDEEPCTIVGYTDYLADEMIIVIKLTNSNKLIPIDRRFLKQMQESNFSLIPCDDEADNEASQDDSIKPQGKSLTGFTNDYIVYDVETTGFSWMDDKIIEIAALKVKGGCIVDEFTSLVNPEIRISDKIRKLTKIDDEMLSAAPKLSEVIPKFKEFIGGSLLIGHNIASFDNYFISKAYAENGLETFKNSFSDTLNLAKTYYPNLRKKKLSELVKFFEIEESDDFHRALNDCYYTLKCYEQIKSDVTKKNPRLYKDSSSDTKVSPAPRRTLFTKHDDLRKIEATTSEIDQNNPFYEKNCVFTGELKKYSREEAAQIIVNHGGKCENNVTKKTNFLIVSSESTSKSGKQKKAEEYKLKGLDINIIFENEFYNLIEES